VAVFGQKRTYTQGADSGRTSLYGAARASAPTSAFRVCGNVQMTRAAPFRLSWSVIKTLT